MIRALLKLFQILVIFKRKITDPLFFILAGPALRRALFFDAETTNYLERELDFIADPVSVIKAMEWKPEKFRGKLDFTLWDIRMFLSEEIADSFGRDCDDFAEAWFQVYSRMHGTVEIYKIFLSQCALRNLGFTNGHMITIVKTRSEWLLCDNTYQIELASKLTLKEVMEYYADTIYKEPLTWTVYKRKRFV